MIRLDKLFQTWHIYYGKSVMRWSIAVQPSPSEQNPICFLGELVSSSMEADFRRKHFRENMRLGAACALMVLSSSVLFMIAGFSLFGTSANFLILLGARGTMMLLCVGLLLALRHCKDPSSMERILLVWYALLAACNLMIIATRSDGSQGHALMSQAVPLVTFCILPLPLTRQLVLSISFSVAAVSVAFMAGVDSRSVSVLAGSHFLANVLGSFASWQLNRGRRHVYLAGVRETELRSNLEKALAEVKTLEGLLPICAWCKRIRDEQQAWQSVESYVQRHTDAKFTHGICDECYQEKLAGTISMERQTAY